ncbi:MAG: hypothetical protein ACLGHI_04540 [Gammaproteobacteria bacterium]
MTLADAMITATAHSCDMYWDAARSQWVIAPISYDADSCALSNAELLALTPEAFVRDYIPERG